MMTATKREPRARIRGHDEADDLGDVTAVARIEERIDRMRTRLDDIDFELRRVETRLSMVASELKLVRWLVIGLAAAVLLQLFLDLGARQTTAQPPVLGGSTTTLP